MSPLIEADAERYVLGVESMDTTHREFMDLVNQLGETTDKAQFAELFARLITHTEAHFDAENRMMEESAFPAIAEHKSDHLRVLGELHRFGTRVAKGSLSMGRAYIKDQLPGWFDLHASTMDSALAAHLKSRVVS